MKKNLNINVEADITDSTNELAKTGLLPVTKELGTMVGSVFGLINNTILVPIRMYNMYAEDKIERFSEELKAKTLSIPPENLVEASMNILGPTMEGLKYNLDEEHIKHMFINILTSDMNKDKKNFVLPSFVEIVKQLSRDDASFLKTIAELIRAGAGSTLALLNIEMKIKNGGYVDVDKYIAIQYDNRVDTIKLEPIIIDNLNRLGLIECVKGEYLFDKTVYEKSFELLKKEYGELPENIEGIDYDKNLFRITEFGNAFLNVCV